MRLILLISFSPMEYLYRWFCWFWSEFADFLLHWVSESGLADFILPNVANVESLRLCSITWGSNCMGWRMFPLWKLSPAIKPDTEVSTANHNLKKQSRIEFPNIPWKSKNVTDDQFPREQCVNYKRLARRIHWSKVEKFRSNLINIWRSNPLRNEIYFLRPVLVRSLRPVPKSTGNSQI